jgi:hypothetical protein
MSKEIELDMQLTKNTKGTHVYTNDEEGIAVPTLYIKKSALPKQPPQVVTVTIKSKEL